jgi:AcrR family transcriptional regulator
MSPKFVDRGKKAKEIATAALHVFSQKGYGASSVEQIAVAAGVAKGTMYEYFPSKDKLYIAAVMVFVENFETGLTERMTPFDDPFFRLVEYIGFSIENCSMENESSVQILFDILQQSVLENGVFYKKKYLVREMMQGSRKMLTDILLEGVSKGIFQVNIARDVEKLAANIIAFLDGASLHRLITENYFNMPEQLTAAMKFLARILLVTPNDYDVDKMIAQAVGR